MVDTEEGDRKLSITVCKSMFRVIHGLGFVEYHYNDNLYVDKQENAFLFGYADDLATVITVEKRTRHNGDTIDASIKRC